MYDGFICLVFFLDRQQEVDGLLSSPHPQGFSVPYIPAMPCCRMSLPSEITFRFIEPYEMVKTNLLANKDWGLFTYKFERTFTQGLGESFRMCHPSFAKPALLTKAICLMPRPPWFLLRVTTPQLIRWIFLLEGFEKLFVPYQWHHKSF